MSKMENPSAKESIWSVLTRNAEKISK